jgi:hypothetical protein
VVRPRRRGWLAPALLAIAAAAVLAVVLLTGGSADKQATPSQGTKPANTSPNAATPPASSTPAAPAPSSAPPPAASLTDFYTRAANDDFNGAWALGTDNLHAQFNGSLATFRSTLATLESIQFPTLRIASQSGDSASIEFSSVATHTARTDHCTGQARMVRQAKRWLVDHLSVNCTS